MTSSKSWGPLGAISVPLPSCMCFPTLLCSLLCPLCRCIATWKQPAADGPSSSAERMAAWTSREHGRSTRRWEATDERTHFPCTQRSIQIHLQRDDNVTLQRHAHPYPSSLNHKTARCAKCPVSKTNRVWCVFFGLIWQDPLIQEYLKHCSPVSFILSNRSSVVFVLAIASRVSETWSGPEQRPQWQAVIFPLLQQEIIT